jgi:hypothetical protein
MTGQGSVVQASVDDQQGLIHAGGTGAAAFLSFVFGDCDAAVLALLQQDLPPGASFVVTFDIVFQDGSLVAVNVHL